MAQASDLRGAMRLSAAHQRMVFFGFLDQAISSLAGMGFTVLAARLMAPHEFGRFSVAWSLVMLFESLVGAPLGGTLPAIYYAATPARRSGLLGAFVLVSTSIATLAWAVAALSWMLRGAGLEAIPDEVCWTLFAAGAFRTQQCCRRFFFLIENRAAAALNSFLFAIFLVIALWAVGRVRQMSPATALGCWGAATLMSNLPLLKWAGSFSLPSPTMLRWFARRALRSGVWLILSSGLYWVASYGLIPFGAVLLGPGAGGGVRLVQSFYSPINQVCGVLTTMLGTVINRRMRLYGRGELAPMFRLSMRAFVGLTVGYSVALVLAGPVLIPRVFGPRYAFLDRTILLLGAVAAVGEALRAASATILVATERTRPVFTSWGAAVAGTALVATAGVAAPSFVTLPAAMATGSVLAAMVATLAVARGLAREA